MKVFLNRRFEAGNGLYGSVGASSPGAYSGILKLSEAESNRFYEFI